MTKINTGKMSLEVRQENPPEKLPRSKWDGMYQYIDGLPLNEWHRIDGLENMREVKSLIVACSQEFRRSKKPYTLSCRTMTNLTGVTLWITKIYKERK